jgi:hypothetical protein
VFAVEFSVGRYLTVDWLRSAARRDLPEGEAGVYDYGKGEIFYIQTEWGHDGQYELLEQGHTRDMLFAFGLDALIFAVHALEHESRVREREQ